MIRMNKSCPVVISNASDITVTEQSDLDQGVILEYEQQSAHPVEEDNITLTTLPLDPEQDKQKHTETPESPTPLGQSVQSEYMLDVNTPAANSQLNCMKNLVNALSQSVYYQHSRQLLQHVFRVQKASEEQQYLQKQRQEQEKRKAEQERLRRKMQTAIEAKLERDDGLVPSCIITANKNMLDDPETGQTCQAPPLPQNITDTSVDEGLTTMPAGDWNERTEPSPALLNLIDHFREKSQEVQQTDFTFDINNNITFNPHQVSQDLLPNKASLPQAQTSEISVMNQLVSGTDVGGGVTSITEQPQMTMDILKSLGLSDPITLHQLGNLRNTIIDSSSTFTASDTAFNTLMEPLMFERSDRSKVKRPRSVKRKNGDQRERNSQGASPSDSHGQPKIARKYSTPEENIPNQYDLQTFPKQSKGIFPPLPYLDVENQDTNIKQQQDQYTKVVQDPNLPFMQVIQEGLLPGESVTSQNLDGEDYKPFSTIPIDGFLPVVTRPPKPHNKELRFANLMLHPDVVKIQRQVLEEWKKSNKAVIQVPAVIGRISEHFDPKLLPAMINELQDLLQINSREELNSCQLPQRYLNIRDDLVELFRIDDEDLRLELRGKLGVRARTNIETGTVLGILRGFMFIKDAYCSIIAQAQSHGVISIQLLDYKATQYAHEVEDVGDDRLCFMLTQYCYGNLLAEVNDPHIDVTNLSEEEYESDNWVQQTQNQVDAPNADVLHFKIAGFPVPVMVTTKSIAKGKELLYSYGPKYWTIMKTVQGRYKNIIADGDIQEQIDP